MGIFLMMICFGLGFNIFGKSSGDAFERELDKASLPLLREDGAYL